VLDLFEFCTPECQAALAGPRDAMKVVEERKAGLQPKKSAAPAKVCADRGLRKPTGYALGPVWHAEQDTS
jgi:hypothetical protein